MVSDFRKPFAAPPTIFGVAFLVGLGIDFINAVLNRDQFLILGLVLVYSTMLIIFNLVVDIVYAFLDPRIRHG